MGVDAVATCTEETARVPPVLKGSFGMLSLFDLAYFLMTNQMTGLLKVDNGNTEGYLEFSKGKLLSVGKSLGQHSDDAALEFLQWDFGTFEFTLAPVGSDPQIPVSTEAYLLDAAAKIDELRNDLARKATAELGRRDSQSDSGSASNGNSNGDRQTLDHTSDIAYDALKEMPDLHFDRFLEEFVSKGGGVLHLAENTAPRFIRNGESFFLGREPISQELLGSWCTKVLGDEWYEGFREDFRTQSSYNAEGVGVFTVYIRREFGTISLTAQLVETATHGPGGQEMPAECLSVCDSSDGLIVIAGSRGSGESDVAASILHHISKTKARVIYAFQQTFEFELPNVRSVVNRIRVNFCRPDAASTIKYYLNQKPDVVYIEELFNRRLAEISLDAAQSGVLVLAAIDSEDCVDALEKLVRLFPNEDRVSIMNSLSDTCRAVVAQKVAPQREDGVDSVVEFVTATRQVSMLIAEGRFDELRQVLKNSSTSDLLC